MKRLAMALLFCAAALARPRILVLSDDKAFEHRFSEMFEVESVVALPFSRYSAVVLDTARPLPLETRKALEQYVRAGGGVAITGAASTAYAEWPEYNIMLGVSGFEGRDSKWGPLWFYENEKLTYRDVPGPAGWAAPDPATFQIKVRAAHAITKGLPQVWLQPNEIQWGLLRGPGKRMTVLATAFCFETRRDEIVLAAIAYGKGRVFHSLLGRTSVARESLPFLTTFTRGVEWAATGKVRVTSIAEFPNEEAHLRSR